VLPKGSEVAEKLAADYDYPFDDRNNLPKVAQYVTVDHGDTNQFVAKDAIVDWFARCAPPDFSNPDEIHRVMAELPFTTYITTNYDNFMTQALTRAVSGKRPHKEVCKWYLVSNPQTPSAEFEFTPTIEEPVVYHLHGVLENVESMVLTEDDYLDFLMYISLQKNIIPSAIEQTFGGTSLLFLGYSLKDMNFKVLFRRLAYFLQWNPKTHVSVQLEPKAGESISEAEQIKQARRQKKYLEKHFGIQKIKIYWGPCEQFATELRARWEASQP
jgi:hypothetical protein